MIRLVTEELAAIVAIALFSGMIAVWAVILVMTNPPNRNTRGERRYGRWPGCPSGRAEDMTRCASEIPNPPSWQRVQCSRKRGHGPDGEFCKQHAKKMTAP